MERLSIQLSDDVEISISKNGPLLLVLWSRVTLRYEIHDTIFIAIFFFKKTYEELEKMKFLYILQLNYSI